MGASTLVQQWQQTCGVDLGNANRLTHVTWADNLYLIAQGLAQLKSMFLDLTDALFLAKLEWKKDSLFIITTDATLVGRTLQIAVRRGFVHVITVLAGKEALGGYVGVSCAEQAVQMRK